VKFKELKVFQNKRNGQMVVSLPKKVFGNVKTINVKLPTKSKILIR